MRRALAFSGKVEYNCGMSDLHTHSAFSPDGVSPLEEMAARAHEQGLKYFGVSEHFDFDYAACGILIHGEIMPPHRRRGLFFRRPRPAKGIRKQGDAPSRGRGVRLLPRQGLLRALSCPHRAAKARLLSSTACTRWTAQTAISPNTSKARAANKLTEIIWSASARASTRPYPYDIVAHIAMWEERRPIPIGCCATTTSCPLRRHPENIIQKGKYWKSIPRRGASARPFLPDTGVLARYFELGGRRLSFGSDAHDISRIAEGRTTAAAALKALGFTALTIPDCGEYKEILL